MFELFFIEEEATEQQDDTNENQEETENAEEGIFSIEFHYIY